MTDMPDSPEALLAKLHALEEDYQELPPFARQADLEAINQLRTRLGLSEVDSSLQELGPQPVPEPTAPTMVEPEAVDHSEAREMYERHQSQVAELQPHWDYAEQVVCALRAPGQTPVEPLATMGCDGGPLLCDHCGKPIVLEGGAYHKVTADVAWQRNPQPNWTSWILGGLVVELQTNSTLRIYHGYPGKGNHCCTLASAADKSDRAAFRQNRTGPSRSETWPKVLAFLESELPGMETQDQTKLLNDIMDTRFNYDPGIGVNRPTPS